MDSIFLTIHGLRTLGTVQRTILSDGSVDSQRDYTPFGEPNGNNTGLAELPYGFTGQEEDSDLGIINMNGRLYDPIIGQFLQADPIIGEPFSQGLNRYAYVDNSPLNATDPSGLIRVKHESQCPLGFSSCVGPFPIADSGTAWDPVADTMLYAPILAAAGYGAYQLGGAIAGAVSSLAAGPGSTGRGAAGGGGGEFLSRSIEIGVAYDVFQSPAAQVVENIPPSAQNTTKPTNRQRSRTPSKAAPNPANPAVENAPMGRPVDGAADAAPWYAPQPAVNNSPLTNPAFQVRDTSEAWRKGLELLMAVTPFGPEDAAAGIAEHIGEELVERAASTLPEWVKNAGSLVNHAKNLEKSRVPITKEAADELVQTARKYGVKVTPDVPHPGTPWDIPHIHVGETRVHVPVPDGYVLPP